MLSNDETVIWQYFFAFFHKFKKRNRSFLQTVKKFDNEKRRKQSIKGMEIKLFPE